MRFEPLPTDDARDLANLLNRMRERAEADCPECGRPVNEPGRWRHRGCPPAAFAAELVAAIHERAS